VACAVCGPRLWFESEPDSESGQEAAPPIRGSDAAIAATQAALARGEIVAIKGLGGYHLACDATSDPAVAELRRRKARGDKPLAVMVADLAGAESLAQLGPEEAALLTSRQRPIVLLRRRPGGPLSQLIAPGNPRVGVLLPYTPVHHLLFEDVPGSGQAAPRALVMTSGNLSDEPICYRDDDARRRLGRLADGWLIHDRPIHVPCDDSVVRVAGGQELPIRRSRGYAPLPVRLPFESAPTLAAGGELKNTFCLASGWDAWMSQHIGDMGSVETLDAFETSTRQFGEMYDLDPARIAADPHPGYQTRAWAEVASERPVDFVQHHHAHIAAVMAERRVPAGEPVIGFAFDGTGYGSDGAIWGGEVLVADYGGFDRVAHLAYVPLPGGDATIRKPYRAALAHLWSAGIDWSPDLWPVMAAGEKEVAVLARQLERKFFCVPTSSMGRLFDAVSALLGVRQTVSFEAQAAIELEAVADAHLGTVREYRFAIEGDQIDPAPVLGAMVADLRGGQETGAVAAGFHVAVARLIGEVAAETRRRTGIERVALSGGVFQNVLLVDLARQELSAREFEVLTHRLVPPNDGGLALGQAAVAGYRGSAPAEAGWRP
jgi:hydrogenase maturation protein HypF